MLTMFAMVLAIGLLVDDAIVVVENVERVMSEEGLSPKDATRKSMDEITSALVGIGLVLAAVFGPMAFFPGSTGVIYRQFSVTVIASMLLSIVVALVLSPVLCASLLKPVAKGHEAAEAGVRVLRPFFLAFDRLFFRTRDAYERGGARPRPQGPLRAVFLLLVACLVVLFADADGVSPRRGPGFLLAMIQLPVGSTLEQTQNVVNEVQRHFREDEREAVESSMGIVGMGFAGRGQNQALAFIKLRDWKLRDRADLRVKQVAGRAMPALGRIRQGTVFAFPPPAVTELGIATGFDFMLQDRGGIGHVKLTEALYQLLGMAAKNPRLARVRPNGMFDVPQYKVDIDWEKAGTLGRPGRLRPRLSLRRVRKRLRRRLRHGRTRQARVRPGRRSVPHAAFGSRPAPLAERTRRARPPLGPRLRALGLRLAAPRAVQRRPRDEHPGGGRRRVQHGRRDERHGRAGGETPAGIGFQWTGLSYQERMAQSQAGLLYAFSVLVIFLVLAALYESWTVPISIMLALPLGLLGGVSRPPRSAACRTTSTSRSGSSPSSGSPPRTRS